MATSHEEGQVPHLEGTIRSANLFGDEGVLCGPINHGIPRVSEQGDEQLR